MSRVLLLFVDGVGIGPEDAGRNAFVAQPPQHIKTLLTEERATIANLDATLGFPGLPQSGTGQYTLFTGLNGARLFGRHHGPYVPTALREPLMRDNVLTRAQQQGMRVAFANSYPEELIRDATMDGGLRPIGPLRAGPPLVAAGAGVLTRHTHDLERGNAVSSEITNEAWRHHLKRAALPIVTGRSAGHTLAAIANAHDLTLYAHYNTDTAGHDQNLESAINALTLVDQFIGGVIDRLDEDVLLVVASDHGNLEDCTAGHTTNPAFGLVAGPNHQEVAQQMKSIEDVAPAIARVLADAR